uniref:Myb-like domain-containing protein n=1 Tax=Capra hircus TaxID=9925 RepID=A0A8C2P9S3_CAPHI
MFRRARLSVKPNVRPGAGARASTAPNSQREQEAPRPQEPAAASAPKPPESTDVPPVDFGEAEPQDKTPKSSVEKTDDGKDVEESSKPSFTVSQKRKRIPSTSSLVKPSVSVPSEPHPLSTVNQEAPQPNPVPTKEKQPCSDRYRIYKAQKLREMLKEELRKEKKQWKNKYAVNETQRPPDRSKMTMRDFIYYLPESNPMTSSLEQEKKTEKSSTPTTPDGEDNDEVEEELDEGPLLVPRVKVAEDGSIILDEESLTVEVLRTKGPCVVEENDPIFERGSTTTYSSFRKSYYSKPWSNKETDMFFLAISMVGTDFSMIGQLFPHRARIEIKNKFKREEKTNGWRIDKAFQEKRPFDFDFFAHLLQKVLAEEEKRKQKSVKNQSSKEKKSSKSRKNVKVKKVANDDRDESVSTKISNSGRSQKDAQTVEEELQSLTLSEQDSEQNALDVNQKKRRRKNQGEGSEQEVHLLGSATVQPGSSKGEKHKSKFSTYFNSPYITCEDVYNLTMLLLNNSSQEPDQTETIKPMTRGRLQRPKPNLSRAVGKKSVLSRGKTDAEDKSLHKETPVEKVWSKSLSEKTCLQEDDQPKAFRPARLMRGLLQRPKPNVGKAVERKGTLTSQEKPGASIEKNENESCINRNVSTLMPSNSSFQNVQSDEPKAVNECLSIQEDNRANKDVRIPKTRFQKPKPNIGRRTGRRGISSKEEVPKEVIASEEMTAALRETATLETSLREKEPVETNTTKEMESDLKEIGRKDISSRDIMPEMSDVAIDLKETRREIFPGEEITVVTEATEERKTDLEETERREMSLEENVPEEVDSICEVETDLKKTEREISPNEEIAEMPDAAEEVETGLEETDRREISTQKNASEVKTVGDEMDIDLKEIGIEISPRDKILLGISATGERETDVEETGQTDIFLMEKASAKVAATEEIEADLRDTGKEISVTKSRSEEIEKSVADLKNVEKIDISLREKEPEETGTSSRAEADPLQASSGDSSTVPSLTERVCIFLSFLEKKEKNSEKEVSSQLSHLNISSQSSELDKIEDQRKRPPSVPEQFSDVNISKSLPQEQTPCEVKLTPFVRSRFKRPKPNLARAASKRETTKAEKHAPGKEVEADETETVVIQQNCEQMSTLPSQLVSLSLFSPVPFSRTHNINTFEQGIKERVIQSAPLVRGRLQRPRPNLRKVGQRQVIEKSETKETTKEEKTLQKDETGEKFLTVVSYCCVIKSSSLIFTVVDFFFLMKIDSPSPPLTNLLITKIQFQRAKPNLGRAQSKKEASDVEEDRADQRKARKPEDSLSQHEGSDSRLLPKVSGKPEFLTSLEVSARKDSVDSEETELAKKDAQSEVEPSGSVGEKTGEDNSVCAVVEKRCISKPSSPQLLKEPDNSKIALDRRRALSSASEREIDHSRRRVRRKVKPSIPKGRGSKRSRSKTSKKEPRASRSVLVTLRASQEADEDDGEDFESDYEEESYHLAPEEVNKAPVFVPIGLRSPEPVPVQIEETMEELVIPTNVTDVGCITVVEHQLSSNVDVIPQEMRQEENLNAVSVVSIHFIITNDGSTEAAITLLTMGDLVLQSEIGPEQSDGICILPDAHSIDQSHIPFSSDNVNLKIVHDCQEPSSPGHDTSPSVEQNKIVLDVDKQNTKEEIGLTEVKENTTSSRTTTSEVTNNVRKRSRFAKPKPNLKKILGTKRFGAHQKVPSLFVTKGEEVEIQRETEKNASQETELEDKNLGSVTATESTEQSKVASAHGVEETSISQEAHLTERGEDQEGRSEEVPISSVAPAVSSESGPHTGGLGMGLGESSVEEPLGKDFNGDPVLTLNVPEFSFTHINLVNVHQDGEDEQTFILTLVEIPEEYADSTMQLMPNPLLPAPILVKSMNTKEREDTSISFPVTSVGQDHMCLSNSERDDSEKSAANLTLVSRKRYHCSVDESDHVPPAKKTSLTSIDDCQKYTSEVCSKELKNVLEETGESYKGQDIFPTSGNIQTISEPQKEELEPTSQSIRSGSLDKRTDTQEKDASQSPQDEMLVSGKEERTCAASESEQMGSITSSSKPPLTRPGRRPLGFLSLLCSKNSLDSDEPTQVHSKKRLKPVIPVSRQNLKRCNLPSVSQKKTQESSDVPSPSVVDNTQHTNNASSATQVSHNRPLLKGECKGGQNRVPEEEPTTVSEYFFNDIFIEVDETE